MTLQKNGDTASPRDAALILVHGFKDTNRKLGPMARHLWTHGYEVHAPTLAPSWGQIPLADLSGQLADFIRRKVGDHRPVVLIGFSMGGLICRHYIQRRNGRARTSRLITIASPHGGTLTAHTFERPGCLDMRRGSPFLQDLDSDIDTLRSVDFTSFWTPFDLMILPASSSLTPASRNIRLLLPAHPLMVLHPIAIRAVHRLLGERPGEMA